MYFPTREIFASLAPFLLKVAPQVEDRIATFKQENFQLFTIGIQVHMTAFMCNLNAKYSYCSML